MAIAELMEFKLKENIREEDYLEEAKRIQKDFTSQQKGFISGKLLKEDNGKFILSIGKNKKMLKQLQNFLGREKMI